MDELQKFEEMKTYIGSVPYVKDRIKMMREVIAFGLHLSESKNDSSYYCRAISYAEAWIKDLGYCCSLVYMNESVLQMIYDKNALENFKL